MGVAQSEGIQAALKTWRDGLVGLTRQSQLLKFRASKTSSLNIDAPPPDEILTLLRSGKPQEVRGDITVTSGAGSPLGPFFHSPRPDSEVGPVVRNLMRKASAEMLDRGLSVLYLAFGMLNWRDEDDTEMVSPVVLVPVKLISQGPKSTPRITENDEEESVLNPALRLRLQEFGISLPAEEDLEVLTASETIAAVRAVLKKHKSFSGWNLSETSHLATFSFAKESMYKDLVDNEETILQHPIVRALATSDPSEQSPEFQFEPIDPIDIDRVAPPESTPLVLDADSSQRAAVAAALTCKTFVMDGPPGTGKSQTIANMIGALLHAGQSVLFVSEKMAALEVVRNRLAAAGLGSYLLELHSHKASRKEVAAELLKTLDTVVMPPVPLPSRVRKGVKQRREQLNDYAAAMNEVRMPLNKSLHHVLGQCAKIATAPVAPVPETAPRELAEAEYDDIQELLSQLVRSWRPAAQGRSFLWREVTEQMPLEVRLYQAESALEELRGTVALNIGVADAFGLTKPSHALQLLALVEHQHLVPEGVMEEWLAAENMQPLLSARTELESRIRQMRAAEEAVDRAAGVTWTSLPDPASAPADPLPVSASPFPLDLQIMTASDLTATADRFESEARMLGDRLATMASLARSLGLTAITTFADVDRLLRLVNLRSRSTCPDPRWFTRPGLLEARDAASALREQAAALAEAETKASSVFTREALSAPVADLQDRFTNLHRGLKKLSGSYRTDKKVVAGLLTNAAEVKNGINHLADAVAWDSANKTFNNLALTRGEILGQHWAGRSTDFGSLTDALNVAEEVLALTDTYVPAQLVAYMAGGDSNHAYQAVADSIATDLDAWKAGLHAAPAPAGRPDLLLGPIEHAIEWLTAHLGPMRQATARIGSVGHSTRGNHSLAEANNLLLLAAEAKKQNAEFLAEEPFYRSMFGDCFDFGDTNLEALDTAIEWAARLRTLTGQPLNPRQLKALNDCNRSGAIQPAYEKWTQSRDRVIEAFASSRHHELSEELDDYSGAVELMSEFRSDTVGQQEWFGYRRAYTELTKWGLDAAVDFCIEQRLSDHEVLNVVNRALLRGWCDAVIQSDDRLRPLLAMDREALVEEYRKLDRELISAATADIIIAVNARRPANTAMGESGVIRREGGKQRRHIPVHELMSRTRTVTTSIKGSPDLSVGGFSAG